MNSYRLLYFLVLYFTTFSSIFILFKISQVALATIATSFVVFCLLSSLFGNTIKFKVKGYYSPFIGFFIVFLLTTTYLLYFIFNILFLVNLVKESLFFIPLIVSFIISVLLTIILTFETRNIKGPPNIISIGEKKHLGYFISKKNIPNWGLLFFPLLPSNEDEKKGFQVVVENYSLLYLFPVLLTEEKSIADDFAKLVGLDYGFQLKRTDDISETKYLRTNDISELISREFDSLEREENNSGIVFRKFDTFFKKANEYKLSGYIVKIDMKTISGDFIKKIKVIRNPKGIQKLLHQIVNDFWSLNEYRLSNSNRIKMLKNIMNKMSNSETFRERLLVYENAVKDLNKNFDKIDSIEETYSCLIRDYLIELSISEYDLNINSGLENLDTHYHAVQEEYKLLKDSIKAYSDLI